MSAFNAAYTISTGSKSTCAPSQWRRTGSVASPNTARNAAARIRMVPEKIHLRKTSTSNIEH
jgi:hypothetical protein